MNNPEPVNEAKLDALLAEVVRRRESGEHVNVESICAAHPDLADSLQSYFRGEELLRAMAADQEEEEHSDTDASLAQETIRPGAARRTDLDTARSFGRYQIIRQLGEGAMGAVYLAENSKLGRQVALKLPKLNDIAGGELLQRFYREARAAAGLKHPNLCQVYDADEVEGTPYIAMEYLSGQPLSRFVGSAEFLDQRRIATVLRDVALALEHAHQAGILHRDLKPGNVIIREDGTPCVTDFGLARKIDSTEESRITLDGTLIGTPAYMSPEQIEGKPDKIGPAADIYSLGAMFYELLTGQLPFQGSLRSIINQALTNAPQRPTKLRPGIEPELEALCLNMLEKQAERRPRSMTVVADELNRWLQHSAPEQVAKREKLESNREKLEGMKTKILDLSQRGQFAAAVTGLEKMAALTIPDAADYVQWAKQKLPEIKAMPQQFRENAPALVSTAKKLMKDHDYAQAADLLTQIPPDFRSEVAQRLLDEAIELQDEADLLLMDLKECVRKKQYEGIEGNLKRFLELKPGNRFAKELYAVLNSYSKVPSRQRSYKYDKKGDLLPYTVDHSWRLWLLLSVLVGLTVFGIAYQYITIYLQSENRTLAVQVDKDWLDAQGGNLSLSVDGKKHTLSSADFNVTVTLGEREFSVKSGNNIVHNPERFEIVKNDSRVLLIDAAGLRLENGLPVRTSPTPTPVPVSGPVPRPGSGDGEPKPTPAPALAVCPFPTADAPRLQQAWADHLGVPVEWTNSIGMRFRLIPPGRYLNNQATRSFSTVKEPVYVAVTEVTETEFLKGKGQPIPPTDSHMPCADVTVIEAVDYCNILSRKEGLTAAYVATGDRRQRTSNDGYRLVSLDEAEFAGLGGRDASWKPTPAEWDQIAWYAVNSNNRVHPVGTKSASPFGIYDIYGNVWEWYDEAGSFRGMMFNQPESKMHVCGERFTNDTTYKGFDLGFRLALPLTPEVVLKVQQPKSTRIPELTPDMIGLEFDGNGYLEIPEYRYDGTRPLTVEATVTVSPDSSGQVRKILCNVGSPIGGIWLACRGDMVHFGVLNHDQGGMAVATAKLPSLNVPHHVAGVVEKSSITLYIDGRLSGKAMLGTAPNPSNAEFLIGTHPGQQGKAGFNGAFKGRIYSLAISSSRLYHDDFEPPSRPIIGPSTECAFHMDEGTGVFARDGSANQRHARIEGANWFEVEEGIATETPIAPGISIAATSIAERRDAAEKAQQEAARELGLPVREIGPFGIALRLVAPLKSSDPGAFYLAETEVTQQSITAIFGSNPSAHQGNNKSAPEYQRVKGIDTKNFPTENVSYFQAARFCNLLSKREGLDEMYGVQTYAITLKSGNGYRLPSRSEFGVAVGPQRAWLPDAVGSYATYKGNSGDRPHPVQSHRPYLWGLFDTRGNVSELLWDPNPGTQTMNASKKGPERGGGCFTESEDRLNGWATNDWMNYRSRTCGFRVARDAVQRPAASK